MKLRSIKLRNFRNFTRVDLEPAEGYNVIWGENASGKTNLCEAIYFASCGRLLKGDRQGDLIKFGERFALIELEVDKDRYRILLDGDERVKTVEINGKRAQPRELYGRLRAVIFTPDDLQLLKGSPRRRRRFLDEAISELSFEYRHRWQRYEQVVRRKNALLRRGWSDRELLAVYNQELVELGAALIADRLGFLARMNAALEALHEQLELGGPPLRLRYRTSLPQLGAGELTELGHSELEAALAEGLELRAAAEERQGVALVGPHRDEVRFLIGEVDLGRFGSQGEQRLAVILVKLAQLELHREQLGDYPVLILDDLLSELDRERAELLLRGLPGELQVFLTYTELAEPLRRLEGQGRFYRIQAGQVLDDSTGSLENSASVSVSVSDSSSTEMR